MTNFTVAITATRQQAHDDRTRALAPIVHHWRGDAGDDAEAEFLARQEFERQTGFSEYTVASVCSTDELDDGDVTELGPTAAVVAAAIKKEVDLITGSSPGIGKDIRHHQICQLAERIADDLYLNGVAARKRFLKACGVA